jgi:hypothetical protein
MSDSEPDLSELFEIPERVKEVKEAEPKVRPTKKKSKFMTEERKAQLRAQLERGRETARKNREKIRGHETDTKEHIDKIEPLSDVDSTDDEIKSPKDKQSLDKSSKSKQKQENDNKYIYINRNKNISKKTVERLITEEIRKHIKPVAKATQQAKVEKVEQPKVEQPKVEAPKKQIQAPPPKPKPKIQYAFQMGPFGKFPI